MILVEIIIQPLIYENFLKIAIYVVLILPFQKKIVKTHIIVVALFLPCLTHGEQVSVTC